MNREADRFLIRKVREGDERAFEALFRTYYPSLCLYASRLLKNPSAAEETVQELFVKLWERRKETDIKSSLKNYLYRSVRNHCINIIRHKQTYDEHLLKIRQEQSDAEWIELETYEELLKEIEKTIESLPDKRKEIFRLNRQEGLKYREISERLNISIKTVETQMGLAIKTLRGKLKDYLSVF